MQQYALRVLVRHLENLEAESIEASGYDGLFALPENPVPLASWLMCVLQSASPGAFFINPYPCGPLSSNILPCFLFQ